MQRRTQAVATLFALLMAVPASMATWGGRGFYEPDTQYDVDQPWMYADPPTGTGAQVYFSTYSGQYVATANANSALLKTNVMSYPTNIHAFLGVWRDCNGDGYIGTIDTLALEYRAELLLDSSVCPIDRTDPHSPNFFPTHNDGSWVREFLWIGPDHRLFQTTETGCYWTPDAFSCTRRENATNPYNIVDEGALIWADWGLPTDGASTSCPVNPRPRGTYQSTGGFLRFVDCHTRWRVTGAVNQGAAALGLDPLAEALVGRPVSFGDSDYNRPDQSRSVLNQPNPYGQPSDDSMVTAWDCSAERTEVSDPFNGQTFYEDERVTVSSHGVRYTSPTTGGQGHANLTNDRNKVQPLWSHDANGGRGDDFLPGVNQPGNVGVNPAGSPAGTVNETMEGATGDCDRTYGQGETSDVYDLDESDFEGTPPIRVRTDIMYAFTEGTRAHKKEGAEKELNGILGQGTPQDNFGVGVANPLLGSPSWFGSPGYAASRNPYFSLDTLQPWGGVYLTSYARVTRTDVQLPAGTARGIYGSDHCADETPITGSFQCDADKWYPIANPKPGQVTGRNLWHAVVGDWYNLKDTDCWDASTEYAPFVNSAIISERPPCDRPG